MAKKKEQFKNVKDAQKSLGKFGIQGIRLAARHLWLFTGAALIGVGLLSGGFDLIKSLGVDKNTQAHALTSNVPVQTPIPLISGTPVHISIPDVSIDLNVVPGFYNPDKKSWTLSLKNAHFATITSKSNNKEGNTFIYAHNRKGVFNSLPKILPGAQAVVKTDSGHSFVYTFESSTITSPEDTSLFQYKGKPILVLQTCTGAWYQDRQLFVFNFTDVIPLTDN
ncbi:sortase [Candidatus Saccharibacteria bacterium]|nr:sortase [Candidatus Saccharibacteria bacterium]